MTGLLPALPAGRVLDVVRAPSDVLSTDGPVLVDRFAPHDDGRAAERVVDAVLGRAEADLES